MPDLDGSVFRPRYNDWQFGVVACKADIACVSFQGRNESLGSIVPDLDRLVIRCAEEVGLVTVGIIINMVDSFSWASIVCFAVALSMLQILMVRSRQAEAKTLVSLGLMDRPIT